MIIWVNGAFGAGKTTLAEELHRRLPEALEFDPEYVGYLLRKWVPMPSGGDFQDIPLWQTLVSDFAIGMSEQYRRSLIVPMTLIHPGYRRAIFERIAEAGVNFCTYSSSCRPANYDGVFTPRCWTPRTQPPMPLREPFGWRRSTLG